MRRVLPDAVLEEIGRLDPAAIAEVCEGAWPDVRDVEELHDALLTLIAVPAPSDTARDLSSSLSATLKNSVPFWASFFEQLVRERRAALRMWVTRHIGSLPNAVTPSCKYSHGRRSKCRCRLSSRRKYRAKMLC